MKPWRLESEVVNGDIVHDGFTRLPIRCLACKADLRAGGHLGTCDHSEMRGGGRSGGSYLLPPPYPMFCRDPKGCAGRTFCPMEFACND